MGTTTNKNKRAIVYVDGLNLYYGLLKNTPYRWLDIYAFVKGFADAKNIDIIEIKYFCARVGEMPHDQTAPIRQGAYLSALDSHTKKICNYQCVEGYFKYGVRKTGLNIRTKQLVTIETSEEKGTDVNIGVHIVNDSHIRKDYDIVYLLSNDSDLQEAICIAKKNKKLVYIIPPIRKYTSDERKELELNKKYLPRPSGNLIKHADRYRKHPITKGKLSDSQLPNPCDSFDKPQSW